jgi:hypothetical protein
MTGQKVQSVFFALVLIGTAGVAAGQTEELVRTIAMEPGGSLTLGNISGEIVVTGVDGNDLTIRATKRVVGRGNAGEEVLDRVEIAIEERGNRVDVEARYRRRSLLQSLGNLFGGGTHVAVDYVVTVPRGTGVSIESVSGDVSVEGVDGETRIEVVSGDVRLASLARLVEVEAVSGRLQITGASSEDAMTAETVSGRLEMDGVRAPRLEASSVSGAVALRGVESRRVEVETVSGSVTFAGALAADGRYEFESHSGGIHLTVPDGTGFELETESFSGGLRSAIPIVVGQGGPAGEVTVFEQGSRSIEGVAGDGGGRLELSTFSGDMTIEVGPVP